jgi:hypothetical protein
MQNKTTAAFDGQNATLTLTGELVGSSEMEHHILAALLDKKSPPKVSFSFENDKGVLTYKVVLSHTKDILAEGKREHDLHVEARNRRPPMTVEALKEEKAQQAKAKAEAEAKAKA